MLTDLLKSAIRPTEFYALGHLILTGHGQKTGTAPLEELSSQLSDLDFCYAALNKVSRSFAVVIRKLPVELRDPVCLFYLVLRGLDSIEDDMSYPDDKKLPLLRSFHEKNLDPNWKIEGVGDARNYRILLANYDKVSRSFLKLEPGYQEVITLITRKMGEGMADFASLKVRTLADYDLYCHYVAGLVGHGLSGLFSASGHEDTGLKDQKGLANSMGLFLQKTNIIRDYHEDLGLERRFWPDEIWKQYAENLEDFSQAPHSKKSLACLNHLVTDALRHVPDSIAYMRQIQNKDIFRFCAIPQAMAIATLSEIYNNPKVFTGVVKVRKGLAAKMMMGINDLPTLIRTYQEFALQIKSKIDASDPNSRQTLDRVERILGDCNRYHTSPRIIPAFG